MLFKLKKTGVWVDVTIFKILPMTAIGLSAV